MKKGGIITIAIILLLACGLSLWLHRKGSSWDAFGGASVGLSLPSISSLKPSLNLHMTPKVQGPYTLTGTALIDRSVGLPTVPYIKYTDQKGHLATKQLIYADDRGCHPGAGDFPCVPTYSTYNTYPTLTDGQHITVDGYIIEDRFWVTNLTVTS